MNTARILLGADDPASVRPFSKALRAAGYKVRHAATGQKCLHLARERGPDLVLLDVRLPDLSGVEVCRQVKREPTLRDVFVVLISGEAMSAAAWGQGLEAGVDDYLLKPMDPDDFLMRIRTIVRLQEVTAALRASERHYRQLVEILPDAFGLIDPQGRILAANPQAASMLGYANPAELLGRGVFDLTPAEEQERLRADIAATFRTGSLRNAQYTLSGNGGRRIPVEFSATVLMDANNEPLGLVAVGRDITERKKAEKRVSAFSLLGHHLSAASTPKQAAGMILEIASELFGWDAGYVHLYSPTEDKIIPVLTVDTIGGQRTNRTASFPLDPSPMMRLVMREGPQLINRKKESFRSVKLVPFGDATRLSASLMFVPIHVGGAVLGLLSIQSYADASYSENDLALLQTMADHCGAALQRIEVAEALRKAEAKYHSIFENATEGIFQTTPKGRFLSANPALARMLGYGSPEELIASVTDIQRQIHVEPGRRTEFKRLLETDGSVKGFETELYRKNGSRVWTSMNAHLVRDAQGIILFYEGTNQDITERKQVEQLRQRAEAELRQLPGRIIEAQEAERLRFARELHDGVNQIIASAKMRLSKVEKAGGLSPAAGEILRRCGRLLAQALEENRRIAHNLRPYDLAELGLTAACRNFLDQFQSRTSLAVRCRLPRHSPPCPPAVELNLFRIVQEALNNVEKHAGAKTVHLQIAFQRGAIELKIHDDGRGFAPRVSEARHGKARGIGLTSMRERAAALGGTCEVESKPNRGTAITVRVPCLQTK